MQSKIIFSENQTARQNKIVYLIYIGILVIVFTSVYYFKNNKFDISSLLIFIIPLVIMLLVVGAKFSVTVTERTITFRYFPFIPSERIIDLNEVNTISVKVYDPISDFGGYGIRKSGNKMLYSMSGNTAIVIEKKNGKIIYLGTLKAKEFEEIKNEILAKNGF